MRIIVLGSAAGGGFPQWNSACPVGALAWQGDPAARWRTQCSLAVSGDGARWLLLNASPDLRQQILATPALHPRQAPRHSPIEAVVLTNGDVDHIAGLLSLRESQPLIVLATQDIQDVLAANPIFNVLNPDYVSRQRLLTDEPASIAGLRLWPFTVPGKVALYLEDDDLEVGAESGATIGLEVRDERDRGFFFVPGCAALSPGLAERLRGADLVFFDGTLWSDDEMIRTGTGIKTGRRMGHMSMSGADGSMAAFRALGIRRRIYIHINNTNPALLETSPERAAVTAAGFEVAHDGMEIVL